MATSVAIMFLQFDFRTSENPASGKRGRNRKFAPTSCDAVMGELLNTFTLFDALAEAGPDQTAAHLQQLPGSCGSRRS